MKLRMISIQRIILTFLFLWSMSNLNAQVYFMDDFENGLGKWLVSGQDWDTTRISFSSPNHSVTDSPNGNYPAYANAGLTMKNQINLSSSTFPVLNFWHKYIAEGGNDLCLLEISSDGGFTWKELSRYTGGYQTWHYIQLDLSSYKAKPIKIRFRLTSNAPGAQYDGWYIDDVSIKEKNTAKVAFPFFDDFEHGLDNWLTSAKGWGTTSVTYSSSNHSITDSPEGNYDSYANSEILLANEIDLSSSTFPVLNFWHKYIAEGGNDLCLLEISSDGGFTWKELSRYTGGYQTWHYIQLDLSSYKAKPIKIRFRLTSNAPGAQYDGWYIDDVSIKEKNTGKAAFPFFDDFEHGLGNWLTSAKGWGTTSVTYSSSNHSITDSPEGNYDSYANGEILLANNIDLSSSKVPALLFWHRYVTEYNADFCLVEISKDGGFNWSEISRFSGSNTTWSLVQLPLSTQKGIEVKIRFRLTSNAPGAQYDGWYIDDVEIKDLDANTPSDSLGPNTNTVLTQPNPTKGATRITLTAQISDAGRGDSKISGAEYFPDAKGSTGAGTAMIADDGLFDSSTENVKSIISISSWAVGSTHKIYVHGKDEYNNWSAFDSVTVQVTAAITERQLTIPDTMAFKGTSIQIPINISDAKDIAGGEFKLVVQNPDILKPLGAAITGLTTGFVIDDSVSGGKIAISFARATGIVQGSGALIQVSFQVGTNAKKGDTTWIVFESAKLYTASTDTLPVITRNGKFIVEDSTVEPPVKLIVTPGSDTLAIGQTLLFTATGVDRNGNATPVNPDWTVVNRFGSIGAVNPASGASTTFTATGPGDGWIIASQGTLADTAILVVGKTRGDLNIDDKVSVPDVIITLQILAKKYTPSLYQLWAADYDGSGGDPTEGDALKILYETLKRYLPKLKTQFATALVQIGAAKSQAADRIEIPLLINDRSDVCGAGFTLSYDAEVLEPVSCRSAATNGLMESKFSTAGLVRLSLVGLDGLLNSRGEIVTLEFKVTGKWRQDLPIAITEARLFDPAGDPITMEITSAADASTALPEAFSLQQNYPNPFNPTTTIQFALPRACLVSLKLFNTSGQQVAVLVHEQMPGGVHKLGWDGRDSAGHSVPAGMYFYQLVVDNGAWQQTNKMVLVK